MENAKAKSIIAEAMKTAGKQQTLNAIQWLGSFGLVKQETVYSDFVDYACNFVKTVPDSKKPSGYFVGSYDDMAELVSNYVKWFAGDDIEARKTV